jgi:hypothetical protein
MPNVIIHHCFMPPVNLAICCQPCDFRGWEWTSREKDEWLFSAGPGSFTQGRRPHTSLRETLNFRIADFKGCVLLSLLLLLFEWPSSSCRRHGCQLCCDPEIALTNSFRGLKKCTNRRPFKPAMTHNFLTFPRTGSAVRVMMAEPDWQ